MDLWVVLYDNGYEGFGSPIGIFSTKEKAEAAANKLGGLGYFGVFKCILDDENEDNVVDCWRPSLTP